MVRTSKKNGSPERLPRKLLQTNRGYKKAWTKEKMNTGCGEGLESYESWKKEQRNVEINCEGS